MAEAARQGPAARNCRISGGQLWVLNTGAVDELEVCIFGAAMISSDSLYNFTVLGTNNNAVHEYLKNRSNYGGVPESFCNKVGGYVSAMTDASSNLYSICRFSDGSAVEVNTLAAGYNTARNSDLTNVIKNSNR